MYIDYNMCCLFIYFMPIPLTPPDDEVGIGIPYYVIIYEGYLYYHLNVMAHLPIYSTMSHYDYVYFVTKATSSMTLLSQHLNIQFQFNYFLHFFLQFLFVLF
jgi:hypothetical protein